MTTTNTTLSCDYMLIGSGAAGLAFLDTLLKEQPDAKVILVDKKARPGGHWVDDYDFVKLHQPSIVYGVASKQLEGNWLKLLLTRFTLPWVHRAGKQEILDYFGEVVDSQVAAGRLQYFPSCSYDFEQKLDKDVVFSSLDGKEKYSVEIRRKLVDGVRGECIIPSLSPPKFDVDKSITMMTPNQIFDLNESESKKKGGWKIPFVGCVGGSADNGRTTKNRHFIVLGCGKTAMDTVVFLQETMGVQPSAISWVIPNDVWMLSRGGGDPSGYVRALLKHKNDKDKAILDLEEKGAFVRLDKNVMPTVFRFPVIGKEEVAIMRKIEHMVRGSRVSSIRETGDSIVVSFQKDGFEDWVIPKTEGKEHIFVHCTSPGPWNGYESDGTLFRSEKELVINILYAPPVSLSLSCIAALESALVKGTLDLDLGRKMLGDDTASGNDILRELIRFLGADEGIDPSDEGRKFLSEMRPSITRSTFVAILDKDPMVGLNWFKENRLSTIGFPGFSIRLVEEIEEIAEAAKDMGAPDEALERIRMVIEKLEPLRGIDNK